MLEYLQCHTANCTLRDFGEQCVAQFAKQGTEQTQQSIGDNQKHRYGQHRFRLAHGIHDFLEHQRHGHVGKLRQHQENNHRKHSDFELQQIGHQTADDTPIGTGGRGRSVRIGIHLGIEICDDSHYSR